MSVILKKLKSKTTNLFVAGIMGISMFAMPAYSADVSWITKIHNNSDQTVYMTAKAGANLGCLYHRGRLVGCNDNGATIKISPRTTYDASWMAVPYYEGGYGERVFHPGGSRWRDEGVYVYQSSRGGKPVIDWKRLDGEQISAEHPASCGKSEYELYIRKNFSVSLDLVWSQCQDWQTVDKVIDRFYKESNRAADLAIKLKKVKG